MTRALVALVAVYATSAAILAWCWWQDRREQRRADFDRHASEALALVDVPQPEVAPGGGTGATTLDELTDVAPSGATDQQVLRYNSGTGVWTPGEAVVDRRPKRLPDPERCPHLKPGTVAFASRMIAGESMQVCASCWDTARDASARVHQLMQSGVPQGWGRS